MINSASFRQLDCMFLNISNSWLWLGLRPFPAESAPFLCPTPPPTREALSSVSVLYNSLCKWLLYRMTDWCWFGWMYEQANGRCPSSPHSTGVRVTRADRRRTWFHWVVAWRKGTPIYHVTSNGTFFVLFCLMFVFHLIDENLSLNVAKD